MEDRVKQKRRFVALQVRLRPDLHVKVVESAKEHSRSLNAEINAILEFRLACSFMAGDIEKIIRDTVWDAVTDALRKRTWVSATDAHNEGLFSQAFLALDLRPISNIEPGNNHNGAV